MPAVELGADLNGQLAVSLEVIASSDRRVVDHPE
jgi:hypothetical protein